MLLQIICWVPPCLKFPTSTPSFPIFSSHPGFLEQGPDPLAADFTFEQFLEQLKGRRGEMKEMLTERG
ncbi:MAG: hypothetical protein WAO55_10975 [Candidatus Manganitrophaceae bacterium]